LRTFAAITDEPAEKVPVAGHDRCITPMKDENVADWLSPGVPLDESDEILDDHERPYYQHVLVA
jgi:putative SOS response-associated peptidase YedK